LSVAIGPDGSYTGWGIGNFTGGGAATSGGTPLLQVTRDGKTWHSFDADAPAAEYLVAAESGRTRVVALPGNDGGGGAVASVDTGSSSPVAPLLRFDPATRHWGLLPAPFETSPGVPDVSQQGAVETLSSDNAGGAWLTVAPVNSPAGGG